MLYALFLTFLVNSPLLEVETSSSEFPDNFLFGVATASYQIEGGWNTSGKGENIWDHLVHTYPERIKDRSTGDISCNSYQYYLEDVSYLTYLGVDFYRFSISWSRLLPTGFSNHINPDGVRYYTDLITHMVRLEIKPMVTLYHWDLPQPLQDLGGWTNPLMANYFEEYANVAFDLWGKYVSYWITFNEPDEVCETGYGKGINAPNINSSGIGDYLCGRTLLLAHARAYHLYNSKYRHRCRGQIGISLSTPWYEPKNKTEEEASERALQMEFGWWANPIFSKKGDYPDIMKERIEKFSQMDNFTASRLPKFTRSEVRLIRGTADFLGLNHYTTNLVSCDEEPPNSTDYRKKDLGVLKQQNPNWEPSSVPWLKVVPWGFRKMLVWIKAQYDNPPIYVTENGFADRGELNDKGRVNYHTAYLRSMLDAIKYDQCNVKAYTIWSLLDNMEWTDGYTVKFGLYFVDFNNPSRRRVAKNSVEFYKVLIQNRQIPVLNLETTPIPMICMNATETTTTTTTTSTEGCI
ncbi:glycoside hydrolase, partial [Oryctes borbonicus]